MAEYWIYENWQAEGHKAVLHRADCSFCDYGNGIHHGASSRHGRWLGPFESFPRAESEARRTGGNVRPCKVCRPVASSQVSARTANSYHKPSVSLAEPSAFIPSKTPKTVTLKPDQLEKYGFKEAGEWKLGRSTKGGVTYNLTAFQDKRVIYSFVVCGVPMYIGVCEGSETNLKKRMDRYKNLVGGSTNKRIVERIKDCLQRGQAVKIFSLLPEKSMDDLGLNFDLVKGLENPLINSISPEWNIHK